MNDDVFKHCFKNISLSVVVNNENIRVIFLHEFKLGKSTVKVVEDINLVCLVNIKYVVNIKDRHVNVRAV